MEKSSWRRNIIRLFYQELNRSKTFHKGLVLVSNLDEDLRFLILLHLKGKIVPNNENFNIDVDSDDYGDPVDDVDAVHGDNVDFADLDNKVDVGDVGRPQHQVQGAPHVSELEAEPLSLSTLGIFLNIVLLFL